MTPPDRVKRPSARPAARPSSPPSSPASSPASSPPPRPEPEPVPAAAPQTAPRDSKSRAQGKKKQKPRASARRPSLAPPAADKPTAPQPANKTATPDLDVLVKPEVVAARVAQPSDPSTPADFDDDGDVFGDSGAVPMAAVHSYPLSHDAEDSELAAEPARGRDRLTKSSSGHRKRDEVAMVGSAQQLDTNDYYFRQYGAQAIRNLSADVDEFGLDPHFEERARPALEALVKRYFRVDVEGADYLPPSGRALIVANRAGALPWDGLVLRTALRVARPSLPPVRWLAEDTVFHYPFLGVTMNRLGAVRACQENAERLLAQDRLVAVFPEGAQGSSKLFRDRYRLQRFGRGGYVKLALKLGAPIIPTAIIGAEETNPLLARISALGRPLGASYLPITPTFPWLGPLGLLPAPVKWRVVVGEPIDLSAYGEHSADDALVVHRVNEQIRSILQSLVDKAKAARRSVFG